MTKKPTRKRTKIKPVCAECGSDDVGATTMTYAP
jgi:hypothetical protein